MRDARCEGDAHTGARTGLVLGNLSLPSSGLSAFAESVWLGEHAAALGLRGEARDRFMSGLPAPLAARTLGLGLGGFALDAACASSLYAIEAACRALQSGRADRMLAGAVNRADDLFLHVGFTALGALSPSGQSRPFHADADGLFVQFLGGQMPVALGKQQVRESDALTCRSKPCPAQAQGRIAVG